MAKLVDGETGKTLFESLTIAETFWSRAVGLLGRSRIDGEEAILIRPCSSIHTFFMRLRLNVAFCDAAGFVLQVNEDVSAWRIRLGAKGSEFALEWSVDSQTRLRVGQRVRIV